MLAALRGTGEAISSETLSYPAGSAPRARIIVSYPDTSMWSAPIGRSTCDESIPSAASDPRHSRPHSNPCPRRALRTTKRGGRYPLQRSHEPIAASAEPIDAKIWPPPPPPPSPASPAPPWPAGRLSPAVRAQCPFFAQFVACIYIMEVENELMPTTMTILCVAQASCGAAGCRRGTR